MTDILRFDFKIGRTEMRIEWDFDYYTRMEFDAWGNPIRSKCFESLRDTIDDKNAFIDHLEKLNPKKWKITLV